jgi:hypothetical protein
VDDAAIDFTSMTWSRQKAGLLEGYALSEINKLKTIEGSASCRNRRRKNESKD